MVAQSKEGANPALHFNLFFGEKPQKRISVANEVH